MDIVAVVVTFLAALLAVRGETWKEGKPTVLGWCGILVAAVGLLASIFITLDNREATALQQAALADANKKLADAIEEREGISERLRETALQLREAEQQRTHLETQVRRSNEELTKARTDLRVLNERQVEQDAKKAQFEKKYSRARTLIKFLLTGECAERMSRDLCAGVHRSWARSPRELMHEGLSAYDAIMKRFANSDGTLRSNISEYGPTNTNNYAAELLR